jgi:hypothetical protein
MRDCRSGRASHRYCSKLRTRRGLPKARGYRSHCQRNAIARRRLPGAPRRNCRISGSHWRNCFPGGTRCSQAATRTRLPSAWEAALQCAVNRNQPQEAHMTRRVVLLHPLNACRRRSSELLPHLRRESRPLHRHGSHHRRLHAPRRRAARTQAWPNRQTKLRKLIWKTRKMASSC